MNSQQEFLINFLGILMWTILIRKNKEYIHYKKRKTFNIFHRGTREFEYNLFTYQS